jgi:hypothetical protein
VGLIILILVTILVMAGFNLSNTNLKVVSNMQVRDEAVAAANLAVEQVVSSNFVQGMASQTNQTVCVNVDGGTSTTDCDGVADYRVTISRPLQCITVIQASVGAPSEAGLCGSGTDCDFNYYYADFEIRASAVAADSGATARVVQGVRLRMSQPDMCAACVTPVKPSVCP